MLLNDVVPISKFEKLKPRLRESLPYGILFNLTEYYKHDTLTASLLLDNVFAYSSEYIVSELLDEFNKILMVGDISDYIIKDIEFIKNDKKHDTSNSDSSEKHDKTVIHNLKYTPDSKTINIDEINQVISSNIEQHKEVYNKRKNSFNNKIEN
jgi:hypothetical protein